MGKKSTVSEDKIVQINEAQIHSHLDRVVRGTVEETINSLLDAEAEQLCNAGRYERSSRRRDYRAGHYATCISTIAFYLWTISVVILLVVLDRKSSSDSKSSGSAIDQWA